MTYASQETSVEGGKPVDLYTFQIALQTYRFTSAEDDQVVGGNTFRAVPISRGKIGQGPETRRAALEVQLPSDDAFASRFVTSVPSARGTLTLQQLHRGDGEVVTLFVGVVKSVGFSEDGRLAKVAVDPPIVGIAHQIPLWTFRGQCNNVLGDGAGGGTGLCTADLEHPDFKHVGTVSVDSGLSVTVPGAAAFGDGWFDGGKIESFDGLDARMILFQVGDVLTLHVPFPFSLLGAQVVLRAGCAHDLTDCGVAKFTNGGTHDIGEYGGFAFVPTFDIFRQGLSSSTTRC